MKKLLFTSILAAVVGICLSTSANEQNKNMVVEFNLLNLTSVDDYSDYIGCSIKLGFFISPTTELDLELFGSSSLDDYEVYNEYECASIETSLSGALVGVTQFIPLSDAIRFYIRINGGVGFVEETYSYTEEYAHSSYHSHFHHHYETYESSETESFLIYGGGVGLNINLDANILLDFGCDYRAFYFSADEYDLDNTLKYIAPHIGVQLLF